MRAARVMFYVQHLLGVGHLKRAAAISRAMVEAGLDVAVVLGGPEVPGIRLDGCSRVLLPPVRAADAAFKVLLDEDGRPIDDTWRERRVSRLLAEFESFRPDVLMLELFPFGRLQFAFELLPLLEAARTARPRPLILSSVRDALVLKEDPLRTARVVHLVERWFDRVLVHGDPALFGLAATFPAAAAIAGKIAYTGYVVTAPPRGDDDGAVPGEAVRDEAARAAGEVIVSAGGGAVGLPLLDAALAARPLSRLAGHVWRLLTGPNLPRPDFERLAWDAPPGVIVERWRDDLPALLARARLSISQAGYNTLMDVLAAGVPAVVVPFAAAGETEQTFRARAFADRGRITLVDGGRLSAQALAAGLAEAIDRTCDCDASSMAIDTTGANTTARLILEMLAARRVAAIGSRPAAARAEEQGPVRE